MNPNEAVFDDQAMADEAIVRLLEAHRGIASATTSLVHAQDALLDWPLADESGARYADNLREVLEGFVTSLDGLAEMVWDRYGK